MLIVTLLRFTEREDINWTAGAGLDGWEVRRGCQWITAWLSLWNAHSSLLYWLPAATKVQPQYKRKFELSTFDITRSDCSCTELSVVFFLGVANRDRMDRWSARTGTLPVPRTTTMLGMRSFAVARPVVWNSFPAALPTAILSPLTFARHLKAHLFGWSAARLKTIYDALYKSTHHHHHHHHG